MVKLARRRRTGVTIVELMVGMSILVVLMMFLASVLQNCQTLWRQGVGSTDTEAQVRKVYSALQKEIIPSSEAGINVTTVPASVGAGLDGDAVWFLSAVDPNTGKYCRKTNGTPYWQRNVLYYLVVPNNHAATFGTTCAGGVGPNGYDDRCPHKVLIRKVIDFGAATNSLPANEGNEETLMSNAQIAPYLTRPNGYTVSGMLAEVGVTNVMIKGRGLLCFRATMTPPDLPPVHIEVRGVNLMRANKDFKVGIDSLYNAPVTTEYRMTVVPENP